MLVHNAVVSCWCTSMMNIAPHSFVKHEATMLSAHGIPYRTKLHKTAISLHASAVEFRYRSHCTPSARTHTVTYVHMAFSCACWFTLRVHGSQVHACTRRYCACSSCARESVQPRALQDVACQTIPVQFS